MNCDKKDTSDSFRFFKSLEEKVLSQRIPITGSIDLTHRCNLRCIHCYNGVQSDIQKFQHYEINTLKMKSIIDEITDAGCLYLLITGGEPLIRRDFKEIYEYVKLKGLITTIFTNGTMITDDIIGLFNELPPHEIEVTLYGATKETYEKITGVNGSFDMCMNGIERLVKNGHNLRLKTILMKINKDEFFQIKKIASDFGVGFRFDAALFPRFDGDRKPISLRVTPLEAVEMELIDKDMLSKWKDYYEMTKDFVNITDELYTCGAGVISFHIDPYGNLKPCLMVRAISCSLNNNSFIDGWNAIITLMRLKKVSKDYKCNKCKKSMLCGYCPAFFELENDSEYLCSDYLCEMGRIRYEKLFLN
jgi:radical SAM protein with 4Fe4S-binding SPASM domain